MSESRGLINSPALESEQAQLVEQKSAANNNNKKPVEISRENVQLLKETPDVAWKLIAKFLGSNPQVNSGKTKPDLNAINSMTQVSKASYFLFQPAMNKAKKAKLKELHEAILCPEVDPIKKIDRIADIKNMLEKDPSLLLEELDEKECSAIRGPSGHSASRTAYRTVLATEDTQLAEMIREKLIQVAGVDEANKQFNDQFPKGWEKDEEKQWQPIFAQLETLTQAISTAELTNNDIVSSGRPAYIVTVKTGSDVDTALTEFRKLLDATLKDSATTGRHFNPTFLLKTFQIYYAHYPHDFGNDWEDPRALAFWQFTVGYAQRFLPVNYVQAFIDGLYNSEEKLRTGLPQYRALKFKVYDVASQSLVSTDFYPLSESRLGFNFAIVVVDVLVNALAAGRAAPALAGNAARVFQSLCQSKTANLQNLCHTETTIADRRCLVQ